MRIRKTKNAYKLLPHITIPIYGLTSSSAQIIGWEIIKFNIEKFWPKTEGNNVTVAVIDTGCDLDHIDLKDNLIDGKNFVDVNKEPDDDNGHGSHVAGIIAASNNKTGMVGVAPKTKILPVKALSANGAGSSKSIAQSVIFAADAGADLITMSLGSRNKSREIENAIKYAASKNVVLFCAAGNSGEDEDIMYPAKFAETIAIGAIDRNLERTNFTCAGDELDFLSPGHDIISCAPNNQYATMSGTSMATPFAVGCAALLLSSYRELTGKKYLSQDDYIRIFKSKARNLKDTKYSGQKKYEGYGILYPTLFE